jgi:protein TonB
MSLLTASPAASSSQPQREENPAEPKRDEIVAEPPRGQTPAEPKREDVAAEPPREQIPAEPSEADAPPLNAAPVLKTNMIARIVRLLTTALPLDKNAIERKLFTEETDSVLVFENGGVIRLSAAVAHGQLLLLTNVELKREVVAQVKRKRVYRPTICFIELEFVEPAPGFWGMEFSAATALLPKAAQDAEAAAMVISAEATADDPGEPLAAPSAGELQAFKHEVEVLRGQPALPLTPAEILQAPVVAPAIAPTPAPAAVPETSSPSPVWGALSSEVDANIRSHLAAASTAPTAAIPVERAPEHPQWTAEEQAQLPQPSLDFSMSLPKRRRSLRARGSFTPNFRGGMLRLALLVSALVVTAIGAAWFKNWIPWHPFAKQTSVSRNANGGNPNTSSPAGSAQAANDHAEFNNTRVASDAPVTSEGMPSQNAALGNTVSPEPKDTGEPSAQPLASNNSVAQPIGKKTSSTAALAGKHSADRPTAKTVSAAAAASGAENVIVPPKLIRSVRAVASLEALRDFETGNVVIDAVVGTAGEVNFISVVSGPPSLRPAAVESLKQYQYEPATRNGQPVPSHVTITIHFRFEP